ADIPVLLVAAVIPVTLVLANAIAAVPGWKAGPARRPAGWRRAARTRHWPRSWTTTPRPDQQRRWRLRRRSFPEEGTAHCPGPPLRPPGCSRIACGDGPAGRPGPRRPLRP